MDGKARWAAVARSARHARRARHPPRLRIDELPQLFNVLRGEMSFVGPRPERPVFVEMLTEQIPFYAVRHSVKPGITGWAQVRYSYGATVEQSIKKLEYDLYYVKNHTLVPRLLILLETVRVVCSGRGRASWRAPRAAVASTCCRRASVRCVRFEAASPRRRGGRAAAPLARLHDAVSSIARRT